MTAAETRRDLLDATMRVLLADGFDGIRVSTIAAEAGVTAGAIYGHFASKAELIATAIREHSPPTVSQVAGPGAKDHPPTLDVLKLFAMRLIAERTDFERVSLDLIGASTRNTQLATFLGNEFAARERGTVEIVRSAQAMDEIDPGLDAAAIVRVTTLLNLGSMAAKTIGLPQVDATSWTTVMDRLLSSIAPEGASR